MQDRFHPTLLARSTLVQLKSTAGGKKFIKLKRHQVQEWLLRSQEYTRRNTTLFATIPSLHVLDLGFLVDPPRMPLLVRIYGVVRSQSVTRCGDFWGRCILPPGPISNDMPQAQAYRGPVGNLSGSIIATLASSALHTTSAEYP